MSPKCSSACCGMDLQELLYWKQFLTSCLNDLFGLNHPVCVARGAVFLLMFVFLAACVGMNLVVSFGLAYTAYLFVGGKKHNAVVFRTVSRDLR
ncbi:uncharacterized protein CDAR_510941 [Caerostris darwini]|uniref:PRA1 family protein n=1 Tax=Caerostris darwini TaxID=1538125 RepID=A0AAV4TAW9_9ARAC|nr:uncharacterized protein CDAR_510941 [Caerostris darwini]